MDPAGLVIIVGIIVTYKLVSRNIDVRRMEAQARLQATEADDSSYIRDELAEIREMLAELMLEDPARRGGGPLSSGRYTDDDASLRD